MALRTRVTTLRTVRRLRFHGVRRGRPGVGLPQVIRRRRHRWQVHRALATRPLLSALRTGRDRRPVQRLPLRPRLTLRERRDRRLALRTRVTTLRTVRQLPLRTRRDRRLALRTRRDRRPVQRLPPRPRLTLRERRDRRLALRTRVTTLRTVRQLPLRTRRDRRLALRTRRDRRPVQRLPPRPRLTLRERRLALLASRRGRRVVARCTRGVRGRICGFRCGSRSLLRRVRGTPGVGRGGHGCRRLRRGGPAPRPMLARGGFRFRRGSRRFARLWRGRGEVDAGRSRRVSGYAVRRGGRCDVRLGQRDLEALGRDHLRFRAGVRRLGRVRTVSRTWSGPGRGRPVRPAVGWPGTPEPTAPVGAVPAADPEARTAPAGWPAAGEWQAEPGLDRAVRSVAYSVVWSAEPTAGRPAAVPDRAAVPAAAGRAGSADPADPAGPAARPSRADPA
ncbi:hypothetical protein [Carbonactinospora thermoautotrophica]|uniref:hypothetical protein n=1 Tax=Carbonactinospora thermoautotrophica TaxID=1469144 RepID=UPI003DAA1580